MRLLLDTHLLLWAAFDEPGAGRLPKAAAELIGNPDNRLLFSAASIWETAIKSALGRPDFRADAGLLRRGLLDNGYEELPITSLHAAAVRQLPLLHKDPFDRLLIAQATVEEVTLLTVDAEVASYPGPIRRV